MSKSKKSGTVYNFNQEYEIPVAFSFIGKNLEPYGGCTSMDNKITCHKDDNRFRITISGCMREDAMQKLTHWFCTAHLLIIKSPVTDMLLPQYNLKYMAGVNLEHGTFIHNLQVHTYTLVLESDFAQANISVSLNKIHDTPSN